MGASRTPDPGGDAAPALAQALADAPATPLLVGFSGGMDSSVLLHALADLPALRARGLRAVHVDHGLHPDAGDWAAHCTRACEALGVPLLLRRVEVTGAGGTEAAARRARFDAFAAVAAPGETLVLAHHRDDQAETVLLRLLRGSSAAGLAGMARHARVGALALWRPLLDLPRALLHGFARERGIGWIEDPSNEGTGPDRNLLRHEILPRLRARFPGAEVALARSARLLREDAERLAAAERARLAILATADPAVLALAPLRALAPPERHALLRRWIDALGLPPPPGRVLDRVDAELLEARPDAEPRLRWSGAELRRYRELLHAHAARDLPRDWRLDWDGGDAITLPGDFGRLAWRGEPPREGPLQVAPRHGGERMHAAGHASAQPLKRLLQQAGVPPWERERLPLLYAADGELLAAGDLLQAPRLAAMGARLRWTPGASAD